MGYKITNLRIKSVMQYKSTENPKFRRFFMDETSKTIRDARSLGIPKMLLLFFLNYPYFLQNGKKDRHSR